MVNTNLAENFRANIRRAIETRGLTQREVARRAGCHHVYLCRVLGGRITPTIATCERLADAVGIDRRKIFAERS